MHHTNNMLCPMCEHGHLIYQRRPEYLPSHVYICNECCFIGFEYVTAGDALKAGLAVERDNAPKDTGTDPYAECQRPDCDVTVTHSEASHN